MHPRGEESGAALGLSRGREAFAGARLCKAAPGRGGPKAAPSFTGAWGWVGGCGGTASSVAATNSPHVVPTVIL